MSRYIKGEALVLKSRPLGESDRLITFLSWEWGKITAVARGARKIKSKLASGVDLFTYGSYQFYRGRGLAIVTGVEVKDRFIYLRQDPGLYPYGLYLIELTDRLIPESGLCPEVCNLLLEGWQLLPEAADLPLLIRAFELKLLQAAGYSPFFEGCLQCGASRATLFSVSRGGLVCPECTGKQGFTEGFPLQPGTVALGRALLKLPLKQIQVIRSRTRQQQELARVTESFLQYHLQIGPLNSLSYIKSLPSPES